MKLIASEDLGWQKLNVYFEPKKLIIELENTADVSFTTEGEIGKRITVSIPLEGIFDTLEIELGGD